MLSFLRSKTIITLIVLLLLGALIGSVQRRAQEAKRPFIVQDIVHSMLIPVNAVGRVASGIGDGFVNLLRPNHSIKKENTMLRRQVHELTFENAKLREAANENVGLKKMLGLQSTITSPRISAEVVSRDESNWFDSATINRGRNAEVENGDAVVDYRGLVGQISEAGPFSSQIVALGDLDSAVGAMVQRSRSCGILQGQGADYLALTWLPKDADIKESDIIVSSGAGQVIPKGFVIGRVVRVMRNAPGGTTSALVRPSVKFDQIEHVFVVKSGQSK